MIIILSHYTTCTFVYPHHIIYTWAIIIPISLLYTPCTSNSEYNISLYTCTFVSIILLYIKQLACMHAIKKYNWP